MRSKLILSFFLFFFLVLPLVVSSIGIASAVSVDVGYSDNTNSLGVEIFEAAPVFNDPSFYMPNNKSVVGNFSFNGGWENNGLSIIDGDIYAQTGYFYNLTSLNVTKKNLTVLDDLYVDGKVGIGTTTPDTTFNVEKSVSSQYVSIIQNTHATAGHGLRVSAGDDGNTVSFKVEDYDRGNSLLTVLGDGKVGIGTDSPVKTLDVNGAINFPTTTTTNGIIFQNETRLIHSFAPSGSYGNNFFAGKNAGSLTATYSSGNDGSGNTGIGVNSLTALTTGYYNTAIGYRSGVALTTGDFNNLIGGYAGNKINTGQQNNLQGYYAGGALTSGSFNVALGESSLRFTQIGINNVAIGYRSLFGASGQDHHRNTAVGFQSGYAITTGQRNLFLGYHAGDLTTSGFRNILIGNEVDAPLSTTSDFLNIGDVIYGDLSTGNVGIGTASPSSKLHVIGALTDDNKLGMIRFMNPSATTGTKYMSMYMGTSTTSAGEIGYKSDVTTPTNGGIFINSFGDNQETESLFVKKGGNVGIGTTTPQNTLNVIGTANFTEDIYVGDIIIHQGLSGDSNNIAIGQYTLTSSASSSASIAIGYAALQHASSTRNIAIGREAGRSITTGNYNIFIGSEAGSHASQSTTVTQSIVLGYNAYSTKNYQVVLGGDNILETLLRGNVGINTSTPQNTLNVIGDANFTGANYNIIIGDDNGRQITSSQALKLESTGSSIELKSGNKNFYFTNTVDSKSALMTVDAAGSMIFIAGGDNGGVDFRVAGNGDIGFQDNDSVDLMYIDTSEGNVGIGTTTPQNTLNVIGDFNVTGIVYQALTSKAYAQTDYHNETDPLEITLNTEDQYENITGLHLACNNSIYIDGQATINKTSMYNLLGSISFSGGNSGLYRFNLFVNNLEEHACGSMRTTSTTELGSMSINCIVQLNQGDKVNMRVKDTTSPVQSIEITTLTFNMVEI